MITLENAFIKATIDPHGAELYSFFNKENTLDYLWNGNAVYWGRRSPVLFPIVGGLIDDTYMYNGTNYRLPRHGFARDMDFTAENVFGDSASFLLKSNSETLSVYPFDFLLRIKYQLNGTGITITYEVENNAQGVLPFSIGAHPAFNVPLVKGTEYNDYYLKFQEEETAERLTLENNLLSGAVPYLHHQDEIKLRGGLFDEDALVFKGLRSKRISLCSDKTSHGLHCDFVGFPYVGIWAAKDAPFVCIEPWYGLADHADHDQNILEKEGIIKLEKNQKWSASWKISCF